MLSIVLSRRDFKEYDQIISLYTKDRGKIKAIAKGVKKITSKNSANLGSLSLCDVEIVAGKEVDRIAKVQPVKIFSSIRSDLGKIFTASHAVILVDTIAHEHQRDDRLFCLLLDFLNFLEQSRQVNYIGASTSFIFKLADVLGYDFESSRSKLPPHAATVLNNREFFPGKIDLAAHQLLLDFLEYHTGKKLPNLAFLAKIC